MSLRSSFLPAIFLMSNALVCVAQDARDLNRLTAGIAISASRFDYREYDAADRLLDRETATLPGFSLSLGGPLADFFWLGELSYQKGSARYAGQTNFNTPHHTTTRETVIDGSMQAGRWFTSHAIPAYALYAGIGHRKWDRDIAATQTVGGLFETYQWWYGFVGAKAVVFKRNQSEWSADIRIVRPFDPTVTIDFKGAYSAAPELQPAARPGMRIAFPYRYEFKQGHTVSLEPYLEQWNLGRSEAMSFRSGSLILTVQEPNNETRNFGVRLTFSRTF